MHAEHAIGGFLHGGFTRACRVMAGVIRMKYMHPFIRNIRSPLTAEQLRPLSRKCKTVQFSDPLLDAEHQKLAKLVRKYPSVLFRTLGHYKEECDLTFLRHYGDVKRIGIDVPEPRNIEALTELSPDLKEFQFGETKTKSISLSFLERFSKLETLYLDGHKKDIEAISKLGRVTDLTLRSVILADLSVLRPLKELLSLGIKLGGTTDLSLLPKIGKIRYLELWMIKGLTDLDPISDLRTLQFLFLQSLKNVETLPNFSKLSRLRRVHLEAMKGLNDLRPLLKAHALEQLIVYNMSQLSPDAFQSFAKHKSLREASVALGSLRKNAEVAELLGLPKVDETFTYDDD